MVRSVSDATLCFEQVFPTGNECRVSPILCLNLCLNRSQLGTTEWLSPGRTPGQKRSCRALTGSPIRSASSATSCCRFGPQIVGGPSFGLVPLPCRAHPEFPKLRPRPDGLERRSLENTRICPKQSVCDRQFLSAQSGKPVCCWCIRVDDPHTQNKRVNGPPAENGQKMWCKCGARRSQTRHKGPISTPCTAATWTFSGADDGIRTRDPHLGKVMLYQLSHVRLFISDCINVSEETSAGRAHSRRGRDQGDPQAQCAGVRTAAFTSSPRASATRWARWSTSGTRARHPRTPA